MQALIFEMKPREGHEDHYFRHAATLRPIVLQQDGLMLLERYTSLSRPGVILSHSVWRDEASIARWRTDRAHQKSQAAGRYTHFEDYRIRISHVLRHVEHGKPDQAWTEDGSYTDPAVSCGGFITITRTRARPDIARGEVFESVTAPGSFLSLGAASTASQGQAWLAQASQDEHMISALLGRTTRDYGLYDRAEAPQYFEPVEPP